MSRSTIELRAAQWYGREADPRTSIKIERYKVLLVVPQGRERILILYTEDPGQKPRGAAFAILNEDKANRLIEALR